MDHWSRKIFNNNPLPGIGTESYKSTLLNKWVTLIFSKKQLLFIKWLETGKSILKLLCFHIFFVINISVISAKNSNLYSWHLTLKYLLIKNFSLLLLVKKEPNTFLWKNTWILNHKGRNSFQTTTHYLHVLFSRSINTKNCHLTTSMNI